MNIPNGKMISPKNKQHSGTSLKVVSDSKSSASGDEIFMLANPNPILTINEKGKVLFANDASRKAMGFNASLLLADLDDSFVQEARYSLQRSEIRKRLFKFGDSYFTFHFCPRPNSDLIDIFGNDISEAEKHKKHLEILSGFSTALLAANTERDIAWTIVTEAISRLNYVDCVIYLADYSTGKLYQIAAHGPKNPRTNLIHNPLELKFGEGIVGAAFMEKSTVIVNDVAIDPRYIVDDEPRKSEIAVPIMANGEVIGIIDSEHFQIDYFTEEDKRLLEAIAAMAATRLQRARAIDANRRTEERFRSFVENAFGGLYLLRGTHFEYVNKTFCKITGYEPEELTDESFDALSLIVFMDENARQAIQERDNGNRAPRSYQLQIKTKAGEIKHLAVNTSILEDELGVYALGISLDITETIQSREELKRVVHSLEQRTDELREFAHLASHNLRAPVTNLMGLLEHYNIDDPTDPTNLTIVNKFGKSVEQLNSALEEMHKILNVRASGEADFRTIKLSDIVREVEKMLAEQIRKSRFMVMTNFEVEEVYYVKGHLDNLFLNLISNAINYRSDQRDPYISIESEKTEEGILIRFQDNGIGIDMEKHGKNLFGMYRRFHNHTNGRGLGLYLIKKQIESLGGIIYAESELGKGTTFTIILRSR